MPTESPDWPFSQYYSLKIRRSVIFVLFMYVCSATDFEAPSERLDRAGYSIARRDKTN